MTIPGRCGEPGSCAEGCTCVALPSSHPDHYCDHRHWPNEAWTGLSIADSLKPPAKRRSDNKKLIKDIADRSGGGRQVGSAGPSDEAPVPNPGYLKDFG